MPTPTELMESERFYPNNPNLPVRGNRDDTPPLVRRLISGVTALFRKENAPSILPTENRDTSQVGVADTSHCAFGDNLWRVASDRASVYRDLDEMDKNDTLISTGLDIIADCTTGYEDIEIDGFEWELEKASPEAMELLSNLKERLNLGTEAWQIVRSFVKFGEEFREVIVDQEMVIRGLKSLPGQTMYPNMDERGNKLPGWYQQPHTHQPQVRIPFEEWQILSFIYGARRGWSGTGLMLPGRKTWRRLQKMEDGMAIARLVRAYDKLQHKVPVKPEWNLKQQMEAIGRYKDQITKIDAADNQGNFVQRHNPFTVETDLYVPDDGTGRGGVELLSARNVQLSNIQDVEHIQKLLLARIKVPRKFLNMGRGEKGVLSDGSLTAEDVQFARTLRNVQAVLRLGLHRLAWLALFFQGYDAKELGLRIRLAKISTMDALMDAKVTFTRAQAAEIFANLLGGLPPHLIAAKYMELDEDEQEVLRTFLEALEVEEEEAEEEAERAAKAVAAGGANGAAPGRTPDADGAVRDPEAVRRAQRRGIARRAGRQVGERTVPRVQSRGIITASDAAEALATLQMLVQGQQEKEGVRFGIGRAERVAHNTETILDALNS